MEQRTHWTLDKKIPLALIVTIMLQTAAAIWWAASINWRVGQLEKSVDNSSSLSTRVVKLEVLMEQVKETANTIERKLDRMARTDR